MTQIVKLIAVHIEGFKSFSQPTDITFPKEGGFYFLGGRNEIEPKLGANGAGKSSLWDAVFWCLYGTSIKGDRASELTSWGAKRPLVSVILEIDDEMYQIERIGSPEKITCQAVGPEDAAPVTQDELDQFLGLTKARFAQAILFGQGAAMFFDKSVPERGALLEEILDLSLWERLAKRAGDQAKSHELEQVDARRDIAFVSGKLEGLTDADNLLEQERVWLAGLEADLLRICEEVETEQLHCDTLENELADVKPPIAPEGLATNLAEARAEHAKLSQELGALNGDAARARQLSRFYADHSDCPTCKQKLTPAFIKAQLGELSGTLQALETAQADTSELLAFIEEAQRGYEAMQTAHHNALRQFEAQQAAQRSHIEASKRALRRLLADMDRIEAQMQASPFAAQIAEIAITRQNLEAELASHRQREDKAKADFRHMDYWRTGFKKVKLFLIKKALAVLALETSVAATGLGLIGWSISYVTETETKSGSLKAGVQILVKSPQAPGAFSLQSGGEEQRVKLAIAQGMSNMIQRMAGVDYRFEVWDEPTAWLSAEGIADLMECLHHRADITAKTLWVIDHRVYDATTFDGVWIIRKTEQGSQLEIL